MFAYQTRNDNGNDALNIMVDGYLPAQEGQSPDVVITKEYSDIAGAEVIVIKVSGNAVVEGASVSVPDATTETAGIVKQANATGVTDVEGLITALQAAGIVAE